MSSASGTGTLTDWLEYVEYLKQVFPKETFRERVFDVLERGVRAFVGDKRYENDVSYVKMWLHYVCGLFVFSLLLVYCCYYIFLLVLVLVLILILIVVVVVVAVVMCSSGSINI